MYNMIIHHVTFSGPGICIFSTQKRSQNKRSTTHIEENHFFWFYVSNYNTHNQKQTNKQKLQQSVAHNSLFPGKKTEKKQKKSTRADQFSGE